MCVCVCVCVCMCRRVCVRVCVCVCGQHVVRLCWIALRDETIVIEMAMAQCVACILTHVPHDVDCHAVACCTDSKNAEPAVAETAMAPRAICTRIYTDMPGVLARGPLGICLRRLCSHAVCVSTLADMAVAETAMAKAAVDIGRDGHGPGYQVGCRVNILLTPYSVRTDQVIQHVLAMTDTLGAGVGKFTILAQAVPPLTAHANSSRRWGAVLAQHLKPGGIRHAPCWEGFSVHIPSG